MTQLPHLINVMDSHGPALSRHPSGLSAIQQCTIEYTSILYWGCNCAEAHLQQPEDSKPAGLCSSCLLPTIQFFEGVLHCYRAANARYRPPKRRDIPRDSSNGRHLTLFFRILQLMIFTGALNMCSHWVIWHVTCNFPFGVQSLRDNTTISIAQIP